jgi:hypothetical protein
MAIEDIGALVPTKVPGYADDADIQAALRIYHYGSDTFDINGTNPALLPASSIAKTILDIQDDVSSLQSSLSTTISSTTFNAKGELLTASADNTLSVLSPGANGRVLSANSSAANGLQWIEFPSSFNTLTANTINVSGNVVSHISTVIKAADYTPTAGDISDDGKLLEFYLTSGGRNYTVPTNANNPYPIGTQISVLQTGSGQVTIIGASGVTINCTPQPSGLNGGKLRAQWSSATLMKRDTNLWVLIGDLSST